MTRQSHSVVNDKCFWLLNVSITPKSTPQTYGSAKSMQCSKQLTEFNVKFNKNSAWTIILSQEMILYTSIMQNQAEPSQTSKTCTPIMATIFWHWSSIVRKVSFFAIRVSSKSSFTWTELNNQQAISQNKLGSPEMWIQMKIWIYFDFFLLHYNCINTDCS